MPFSKQMPYHSVIQGQSPQAEPKIFSFSPVISKSDFPLHSHPFSYNGSFFQTFNKLEHGKCFFYFFYVFPDFLHFFVLLKTWTRKSTVLYDSDLSNLLFFFQNYVIWTRKICQTNTTYVHKKIIGLKIRVPPRQNQKFLFPPQNLFLPRHFKK